MPKAVYKLMNRRTTTTLPLVMLTFLISTNLFANASLSMNANLWNILYSVKMPFHPTASGSNAFFFDFPDSKTGEIDYLTQNVSGPIVGSALSATITITTTGTPTFDYKTETGNTCTFPAHARFYIQKVMSNDNYVRWWANPISLTLAAGTVKLVVPLNPSQWQDTWGHVGNSSAAATSGFKSSLARPTQIGLTFGGGCFFGHGVRVTNGTARFKVTDFNIAK